MVGSRPVRALLSTTVALLRPALLNSTTLIFVLALEVLGLPLILGSSSNRSTFRHQSSLQHAMLWPRTIPGLVTGMAFFWAFAVFNPGGALGDSLWGIGLMNGGSGPTHQVWLGGGTSREREHGVHVGSD